MRARERARRGPSRRRVATSADSAAPLRARLVRGPWARRGTRCRAAATIPLVILTSLEIDRVQFERATGWALKPQGACKGEICVPLMEKPENIDATVLSARLGMALV